MDVSSSEVLIMKTLLGGWFFVKFDGKDGFYKSKTGLANKRWLGFLLIIFIGCF